MGSYPLPPPTLSILSYIGPPVLGRIIASVRYETAQGCDNSLCGSAVGAISPADVMTGTTPDEAGR